MTARVSTKKHAFAALLDAIGSVVGRNRRAAPASKPTAAAGAWNGVGGTEAEERSAGAASYLDVLDRLHRELRPARYLEIGVRRGHSLALARGPATGVDPAPDINVKLPPTTGVAARTSDDFFADDSQNLAADFCFIDGLHHFEYALRDFMNIERHALPGAVVVVDDIFPNHPAQAERQRRTRAWTGDVWHLYDVLRTHRPDLFLLPLDTTPTGLLLIAGLDPSNRVLQENYDTIVAEALRTSQPPQSVLQRYGAIGPSDRRLMRVIEALKSARRAGAGANETVAQLNKAMTGTAAPHATPAAPPKLSIVLIGYNMARELPRTIRSLTPDIQCGIDPRDYEVILIDNGSTQGADEAELRRLMPNLITHRFAAATVSPASAMNFGLTLARGDLVGAWIDGARMASPRLLAKALAASRLHPRPMIGTIAFHLGPDTQMQTIKSGYDQAVEDKLLAQSGWETDPYALFSISSFAGSSAGGWFDLPAESSALFLHAEHWRELGGYDTRFKSPGGGLVNLDMWSRVCADQSGELIMLLGEATFHQFHGGVSINNPTDPFEKFHEEYIRIRGAPYQRPTRAPLYFGTLPAPHKSTLNRASESANILEPIENFGSWCQE